ncbi:hypothetical protein JCM8097_001724 [Rhodosporidiobolus ruineniae]
MVAPSSRTSIASLPTEILIHIFALARDCHDQDVPPYSSPFSPTAPRLAPQHRTNPVLALSHTCRTWYSLVSATAELWSSLHLDGFLDADRAEAKASFWAQRAIRTSGGGGGNTIQALYLTQVQDWSDDDFAYLCEALELLLHIRLTSAHISWMGGGAPANEHRQLQSFFRFLLASAPTFASLTLHTPSHLRILFSLPRLGHSFTALEELEIQSTKISSPASDAYLVPAFLPRFGGETDWAPLTHLRRLVLVGPIWRLRYRDGTVASPTLEAADVPTLRYARLSSTSPPVHWDLLSAPSIQHLHLDDWFDHPTLPDPDPTAGFTSLTSLSLVRCGALATRLLDLAATLPGLTSWPNLELLRLTGARLSQAHLNAFSGIAAPRLAVLDLSDSSAASSSSSASASGSGDNSPLVLPPLPALRTLTAFRVGCLTPRQLVRDVVFEGKMGRLEEVRSDLAFGEDGERALLSVGVRVVSEEDVEGE